MLLSGLKAEAEGHAIVTTGVAKARVAVAVHHAERRGVEGIRRALPPDGLNASLLLDLAVARLVVSILRAFACRRVGERAEDFDLAEQKQLIRRGVDGAAPAARRGQFVHLPDAVLYLCRHQGKDGGQVRRAHCAVLPAAGVRVRVVHVLGLAVAVVHLECQRSLAACGVGVVILADDVDLIPRTVDGHRLAVAHHPCTRHATRMARRDDGSPVVVREVVLQEAQHHRVGGRAGNDIDGATCRLPVLCCRDRVRPSLRDGENRCPVARLCGDCRPALFQRDGCAGVYVDGNRRAKERQRQRIGGRGGHDIDRSARRQPVLCGNDCICAGFCNSEYNCTSAGFRL